MGIRKNRREGRIEFAAGLYLRFLDTGRFSTFVRKSSIDFSWASSAIVRRVFGWRVIEEFETLSDQIYIYIENLPCCNGTNGPPCGRASAGKRRSPNRKKNKRWTLSITNVDMLVTTVIAATWLEMPKEQATFLETEAISFQRLMIAGYDAAMPWDKHIRRNPV